MRKRIIQVSLGALSLLGCSVSSAPKESTIIADYSSLDASPAVRPASEIAERLNERLKVKDLTLGDALALTLEKSPELKSFSRTVRIGEAREIQAGLRPNPDLSIQVEDAFGPFGGDSYSQATLQLSQVVELGGKRMARLESAKALHDQLKDEYEIKRIEVLSSLTDKFIRTAADEQLLKLSQRGVHLAKQTLDNVVRRAQSGGISELEEIKARVALARSQVDLEHAEHELLSSKRQLSSYWGEESPPFDHLTADIFREVQLPSYAKLVERIEQSPEIKKWATEQRLREAEQKLAEANATPNLTVGAGPRQLKAANEESWVFQVSLPLTIFDRNQGARQEAAIATEKAVIDQEVAQIRLKTLLFALYQEAKHAQVQLRSMKDEVLPLAERSLQVAQTGYDIGRLSYLDLLDAQRTLLEVCREYVEVAYSLHSFINSIERLLGAPLAA